MSLFDSLFEFFIRHGLKTTLVAIGGILLLGTLKYANVFKRFEATLRHILYLIVIMLYSLIGSLVYLCIEQEFSWHSVESFNSYLRNQSTRIQYF